MTQTIQCRSWALLSEPDKVIAVYKPGMEDDINLMRPVLEELSNLKKECERLTELIKINNNLFAEGQSYLQIIQKLSFYLC